jgi:DNA-binding CsgD family transcriptional regulator
MALETMESQALLPLRKLSGGLLRLADLARTVPAQALLEASLKLLDGLVPFDSAWWGEVSAGTAQAAPRNWLHGSLGLSKRFADEWNRLSMDDSFALQSIAHVGKVIRQNHPAESASTLSEVEAFGHRHGLARCMAVTVEMPHTGLLFFVSVYRTSSRPAFSEQDEVMFGEFVSHLLQHWRHALEQLQASPTSEPWDGHALADQTGNLLFIGIRIGLALKSAYPGWSGTELPEALLGALSKLPCSFVVGKSGRLRMEPCGSYVAISLATSHQHSPLSPRELGAAMHYANGRSSKEIATVLGLTPATVRTYLRSTYMRLGVRNKVELQAALRKP